MLAVFTPKNLSLFTDGTKYHLQRYFFFDKYQIIAYLCGLISPCKGYAERIIRLTKKINK